MTINYVHQQWDSDFFGFQVARILQKHFREDELLETLNMLRRNNYRLAYWDVPYEQDETTRLAVLNGGFHADKKLTYARDLEFDCDHSSTSEYSISSCFGKELDTLVIDLALKSSQYSRFRVDPNFPKMLCDKLYTHWIAQSLNGNLALEVLVAKKDDRIIGLITLGCDGEHAKVGLIAVSDCSRRKGVGKMLLNAATKHFLKLGFNSCQIVTQKRNNGACRLYESSGYKIVKCVNTFHFWL